MITTEACKELYKILDRAKKEYPDYNFMFYNSGSESMCRLLYANKDDKWALNEKLEDEFLGEYYELCLDGKRSTPIFVSHDSMEQIKEGVEIIDEVVTIKEEFYSR